MTSLTPAIERAARQELETRFEYLLDDPHGYGGLTDIREMIASTRILARDLGVDYDTEVRKGSDYEQQRLREIEKGGENA